MSRNSKDHVLVAHSDSCTDSRRTSPSGQTHESDTPGTMTMRRSRVHSENTVPLKSPFDLWKSGTIISEDGIRENRSHVARRSDGTTGTAGMGTSCKRGIHASREAEHLVRTRGEGDEVRDERQSERLRRLESKEQDRAARRVQGAQRSVVRTRDETTGDKEDQRGTSRTRITSTGNPGLRTTQSSLGRKKHTQIFTVWNSVVARCKKSC